MFRFIRSLFNRPKNVWRLTDKVGDHTIEYLGLQRLEGRPKSEYLSSTNSQ